MRNLFQKGIQIGKKVVSYNEAAFFMYDKKTDFRI